MNNKLLIILGLSLLAVVIIAINIADPVVAGGSASSIYLPLIMRNDQTGTPTPGTPTPGTPTPKTPTPAEQQTITPAPTITPKIPEEITDLATAKPPKNGFVPPNVQIASLALINKTNFALEVAIGGISDSLIVLPGGQAERQLAPGIYSFTVRIQGNNWPGQSDTVELKNRMRVEITFNNGTLAFSNATDIPITISISGINIDYAVAPHTTSAAKVIPPGVYTYTIASTGVNYQFTSTSQVTIGLNSALTITLSAPYMKSSLRLKNLTPFEATMKLTGIALPIVASPSTTSSIRELPSGTYDYIIQFSGANSQSLFGTITLEPGYAYTLTVRPARQKAELSIVVSQTQ